MKTTLKTSGYAADRLTRFGRKAARILQFMWRHFMQDRILLSAGSLAFETLLSIVPLFAVVMSTLQLFPFFSSFKRYIGDFLFQNFPAPQSALLKEYLWLFIDKATTVSTLGGIFLVIIALLLIATVDHTLNDIWEVHAPRKPIQGFTLYWTVLTLGPVFIGTSLAASSYVWFAVFTEGPLLEMKTRLLSLLPFINSIVAFTLLYLVVPNRRVRFDHALSGGLLVALLFEIAKRWFTFYVSNFATFEHIYGAVSVVPMLFFWIYLEWVVVLTGAELVYSLGCFIAPREDAAQFDPLRGLPLILSVINLVWVAQQSGRFMTMKKLFAAENIPDRSKLSRVVEFLAQQEIMHVTAEGGLAVTADLHSVTLYDLYAKLPADIIRCSPATPGIIESERFAQVRLATGNALESVLGVALIELINDSSTGSS